MSKRVTLSDQQIDLLLDVLRLTLERLDNEGMVTSKAHKMAGRFTYKRINEIILLLETDSPSSPT